MRPQMSSVNTWFSFFVHTYYVPQTLCISSHHVRSHILKMLANRSYDDLTIAKKIKDISKRTRVRFCNEFKVRNGTTLGLEFEKFGQYTFKDYLFVAVVVARKISLENMDDQINVMQKYGVTGNRGGGIFLHGMKIQFWGVTVDGINFIVFGPYDFAKLSFGPKFTNQNILQKIMYETKQEIPSNAPVFKIHVPERRVHQIQDPAREN